MESYEIKRIREIRQRTDYIILIPSVNFIENQTYITPLVRDSGYNYTWGIWEKYFLFDLHKRALPCHFFMEQIGEDFTAIVGLAKYHPSYFLEDLTQTGIIDYKYKHSIVIMLNYAFDRYIPEKRMYKQLANKLLDPLLREYELQPNRIKLIDECFKDNWKEYLKDSKLTYELTETKNININILNQFIFQYKNYY